MLLIVKLVSDIIASTILVSVLPLSFLNEIESPITNSELNLVLKPLTAAEPLATVIVPVSVLLIPLALSKEVSAVNAGEPAIPSCLTCGKSKVVTPLNPTALACITAVLEEVPPVIVSPGTKVPVTSDTIATPCAAVADVNAVIFTEVVPSAEYNSKVVAAGFLTV